ncbi:N-acetylglucosamine-6-phosphate deacetylase [Paenibacillus urinalis]|uniref:N-acetylglucosamine-6-phosphate deacetylase n=1 Tax=Paenibacillus urinalis TaxID=521520 RepID=A0AAX3N1B4_9BACL|nr:MULTISPECIES: hypothetical protein [Paenibacillus]WDH82864.1 N-acetylglucosamine-6-phosphate deacetylase [Paenibacillus urinalis]WDH98912.1 N-acetylglucosamine-6-phosphate deacetylase [Paenibacillus urinalis]WDI02609.1 N-acetylglucosamine-6-phosphate deacetylase [Paenibacillus urinalis]GAK42886.1 hypothetical protein TCA2_5379 [Paenibacillus sp. TCA20]
MVNTRYTEAVHYATGERIRVEMTDDSLAALAGMNNETVYFAPGLVDLQVNGYMGIDFNSPDLTVEQVHQVTRLLQAVGVVKYCPTVITNSEEAMSQSLRVIAAACAVNEITRRSIAGVHLEGPFISPEDGPRGAHPAEFVTAPDIDLFQRLQSAATGMIRIVTMSPEWAGSQLFIEQCVQEGIIVSIGHTAASSQQIFEAVRAGALMSTHLGNGAHLMLPRHPNYIWEQLAADELYTCFIADGFHLPDAVQKVIMRVKKEKAILVSDAAHLAGLPAGDYQTHIGGRVTLTELGKLHLTAQPELLAGSAQMLIQGISRLVRKGLCTLEEAWNMGSVQPWRLLNNYSEAQPELEPSVLFTMRDGEVQVLQTAGSGVQRI